MINIVDSPEAYFSLQNRPNRLMQSRGRTRSRTRSCSRPASAWSTRTRTRRTTGTSPTTAPSSRVCEVGSTAGLDSTSPQKVNTTITDTQCQRRGSGTCNIFTTMNSGSHQRPVQQRAATYTVTRRRHVPEPRHRLVHHRLAQRQDRLRGRVLRGGHPATRSTTCGSRITTRRRIRRVYDHAAAANPYACGNMSLYYGSTDPSNTIKCVRGPIGFEMNTGVGHDRRARLVRGALPAGSVDAEAVHAERRRPLRPRQEPLRRDLHRPRQVRARPGGRHELLVLGASRWRELQRHHAALGRGVGRVRHRQDVGQVEHGQVPAGRRLRRHLHRQQPGAPVDEPR